MSPAIIFVIVTCTMFPAQIISIDVILTNTGNLFYMY